MDFRTVDEIKQERKVQAEEVDQGNLVSERWHLLHQFVLTDHLINLASAIAPATRISRPFTLFVLAPSPWFL